VEVVDQNADPANTEAAGHQTATVAAKIREEFDNSMYVMLF
jgi:hypothetical protein